MPWKAAGVVVLRQQLVQLVRQEAVPVAQACRQFGVSRDTAYRWLARHDADPGGALEDRSRRPHLSPARTHPDIERHVLDARDRYGWGARKIRALLQRQGISVPSARTVHAILARRGPLRAPPPPTVLPLRFERPNPNDLWQMDHKCDLEIQRTRTYQLTILDDHSRYLLRLDPVPDRAITTAFTVLWELMGEVGMPTAILCDNAFSTTFQSPATVSWFDANLLCLGIRPIHGRPYHPQTQGKVERLHGPLQREFVPTADRTTLDAYRLDARRWRGVYNDIRPHEALGDVPPAQRWCVSPRPRPSKIPEPVYLPGSLLRKVSTSGDVRWNKARIMAGRGLVGRTVRIQETAQTVDLYFCDTKIRSIALADLRGSAML